MTARRRRRKNWTIHFVVVVVGGGGGGGGGGDGGRIGCVCYELWLRTVSLEGFWVLNFDFWQFCLFFFLSSFCSLFFLFSLIPKKSHKNKNNQ